MTRKKAEKPKAEKKPLTVQEFAALGGAARAKKLTKEQRQEIARKAAQKRWKEDSSISS